MEDNKHNELDELFRSRILDEGQEEASWNLPSDEVFDKAMATVNSDSGNKRKFIFFWISGISLAVLLLGLTFWNIRTMDSIDEKMDQIIELQKINSDQERLMEDNGRMTNEGGLSTSNNGLLKEEKSELIENSIPRKTDINKGTSPKAGSKAIKNSVFDWPPEFLDSNAEDVLPISIIEHNKAGSLPQGSASLLFDLRSKSIVNWPQDESISTGGIPLGPISKHKEKPIRSNQYGIYYGPNWSTYKMTSSNAMAANLKKYDQWYGGLDLGIFGSSRLKSRWQFLYGLNYSELNNESQYESEHLYNKSMETTNNQGQKVYTTKVDVFSTTGLHSENMELSIGSTDIADQDILLETTNINDQLKTLKLDFGLSFSLFSNTRWSTNIHSKIGLNYLLEAQEQMTTRVYHQTEMLEEQLLNFASTAQFNPMFISSALGLTTQYKLSKHWALGLNIEGQQSLQSIQGSSEGTLQFKSVGTHLSLRFRP
jgi:hypothetical protein